MNDAWRVMIVDDDPGMLRATERVLAARYQVAVAESAPRALQVAKAFKPDLIVCDIRMPEMDGFALVSALRGQMPELDAIFMTGSHSEPDAHLIRAIEHEAFYFIEKPFDRRVLSVLVERCLELRRLRQAEHAYTSRLEQELAGARVIQRTMLAPEDHRFGPVRVRARCIPCQELAGDLYDYRLTPAPPPGHLAFIVADVCGHGASAALLTALVKSAFHADDDGDPLRIVRTLAAAIGPFGEDRFITAFAGVLDLERNRLTYVNAGHPPALAWAPGKDLQHLASTGPLICSAFSPESWSASQLDLGEAWALVAHTDGLTESLRKRSDACRLADICQAAPLEADAIITTLRQAVEGGLDGRTLSDDVTMLAIARRAP